MQLERSREAEKASAALAERTRISREMHDVLAHTLSALVLQLEALAVRAERAAVLGGQLHAGPVDDGFHVRLEVPA